MIRPNIMYPCSFLSIRSVWHQSGTMTNTLKKILVCTLIVLFPAIILTIAALFSSDFCAHFHPKVIRCSSANNWDNISTTLILVGERVLFYPETSWYLLIRYPTWNRTWRKFVFNSFFAIGIILHSNAESGLLWTTSSLPLVKRGKNNQSRGSTRSNLSSSTGSI